MCPTQQGLGEATNNSKLYRSVVRINGYRLEISAYLLTFTLKCQQVEESGVGMSELEYVEKFHVG